MANRWYGRAGKIKMDHVIAPLYTFFLFFFFFFYSVACIIIDAKIGKGVYTENGGNLFVKKGGLYAEGYSPSRLACFSQ